MRGGIRMVRRGLAGWLVSLGIVRVLLFVVFVGVMVFLEVSLLDGGTVFLEVSLLDGVYGIP